MTKQANGRILIVDDDLAFRVGTLALLEDHGFDATIATNGAEAMQKLSERQHDLVLSDLVMPGMNGIELLRQIKSAHSGMPVIMVTGFASIGTAVEAMRHGARDYVTKPCDNDELLIKIRRALEEQQKDRELRSLRDEVRGVYGFGNLVGRNARMKEVYTLVQQVAGTDVPALILGETGTGKELVARAIHRATTDTTGPFVAVDCGAIPETLFESELFGHEKGAFTGSHRTTAGKFEAAADGTVFLDEISNLPAGSQAKLLRVLQERRFFRLGGTTSMAMKARVIAASNHDLETAVASGSFRRDLMYRLNEFVVCIPPLRERRQDIVFLAKRFVDETQRELRKPTSSLTERAVARLLAYDWPGNVRQLRSTIRRALLMADGVVDEQHLMLATEPSNTDVGRLLEVHDGDNGWIPLKKLVRSALVNIERTALVAALKEAQGNKAKAARLLRIDYKTMHRKVKDYGLGEGENNGKSEGQGHRVAQRA
jgi:DNA-binding NtrC family response regulator